MANAPARCRPQQPRKYSMNALAPIDQTMTSREIAELTGKLHAHVLRDVRTLLIELGVTETSFGSSYIDGTGRSLPEFTLPKRETMILCSGYSATLRAAIIDRWTQLEAAAAPALPTFVQALRMLADQTEQSALQAAELALAAPKVAFVNAYVAAEGNKGFRQVAKLLAANERHFGKWLDDAGITYRLGGERTARSQHSDAGRFVAKTGNGNGGTNDKPGHAFVQMLFTPKGVNWVAGEWAKHQVASGAN
jgi:phage antirepressor YoqD-like protein